MVKAYWKVLPALHVPNIYGKIVPLRHPMVKPYHAEISAEKMRIQRIAEEALYL